MADPTFRPHTYWAAWPNNTTRRIRYFGSRSEAESFLGRNGGGAMRRMRALSRGVSETTMDAVEVPARGEGGESGEGGEEG